MRLFVIFFLLWQCLSPVFAQETSTNTNTSTTTCTFEDGQEITVRYDKSPAKEIRSGVPWQPGGSAMILFTPTALTIHEVEVAPGAYSMWLLSEKKGWTLAVNKNVKAGSPYDPQQDLVRIPMEIGQLTEPLKQPDIGFAHMAAKECNLRIYYGKIGAWAEMDEK